MYMYLILVTREGVGHFFSACLPLLSNLSDAHQIIKYLILLSGVWVITIEMGSFLFWMRMWCLSFRNFR